MACANASGAPCAWVEHYEQAQNELLLARYEAQRWKEKYLMEKQRRRKLARSLLDTMALVEETKRAAHATVRGSVSASDVSTAMARSSHARPRRSSSTFSDKDQIESLLSPTLSSFDFDDDDELEDEDGDADSDCEEDGAYGKATSTNGANGGVHAAATANGTTAGNRRSSVLRAASEREVRPTRSSTLGSYDVRRVSQNGKGLANGWRRGTNQTLPPSNLLYRMLYTKSSSRDLWSTQSNKFHSVARSVMFSMQLKKEHVFEHFFVVGLQIGETERAQAAARRSGGLAGFWKPRTFYEFPQRAGRPPDASIADFCFPMGVPVVECKPHQYSTLLGSPVSIWSTDAEELQKHALDPFRSSGYTFRLTGAKGEVLYGFCVAVMTELFTTKDGDAAQSSGSPRGEWSKRASCPNGSALRMTDPAQKSYGASSPTKKDSGRKGKRRESSADVRYLAPVCYCFTSKFPFYKLHFAILRMVIENTIRAGKQNPGASIRSSDLYDVTLTVESNLGVEFAVCRQPNAANSNDNSSSNGVNSVNVGSFSSVSSGIHKDQLGEVVLSEEVASASHSSSAPVTASHDDGGNHSRRANGLKKSFSSDDITSYDSSTACVVEKPVVVRMNEPASPRVAAQVQVGDVLEAIDGISTASLTFAEALDLIESSPRPVKLRFHRLRSRKPSDAAHSIRPPTLLSVIQEESFATPPPTSIDILQRVRRFRIGDPGEWSSLRLPDYAVNYQFPKRDAERWAVGVILRYVTPDNIVKILAHLLLEKQVVIMGANSSLVTATCTALLLLLAPFQWQSTYIPQLPASLLDFLHSPVPFLVGCQPLDATDDWPDVCFVNIDTNVILAPIADHHINSKSIPHGSELTRLFQGAAQRYQRLRLTSKPWHELSDDEDKVITLTMQESQIFLKDACGELTSLNFAPETGKSFYEQLQQEVTSIVRKSNFEDFLEEFSQTQMFCQYCETVLKEEKDEDAKFAVRNSNGNGNSNSNVHGI